MPRLSTDPVSPFFHRRRRFLPIVDARFQLKYTLLVIFLGEGTAAILGIAWLRAHQANTRLLDLTGDARLAEHVARADSQLLTYLLATLAAMGLSLGVWGLVVTHRIIGPTYLVARYCGVIASGHYPDVRPLRKHDELKNFFNAFCGAVAALRQRDLATLDRLEKAVAAARFGLQQGGDTTRALEQALEALDSQRREVAVTLGPGEGVSVN